MPYDLFHQLHYICSNQKDSSAFLEKLKHMSECDIQQYYTAMQLHSQIIVSDTGTNSSV